MTNTKSYNRDYYLKNREKLIRGHLKWYYDNQETRKEYGRNYYKINRKKVSEKTAAKRAEIRRIVFAHYGGKCACCGEQTPQFLTIDHIENNGAEHRKKIGVKCGWVFYKWLLKNNYPEGHQLLCFNCNTAKGFFGICPHQQTKNLTLPTT